MPLSFGGGSNYWGSNPDAMFEGISSAGGVGEAVGKTGGGMGPIGMAIGAGISALGSIFGGLAQARKEKLALKREENRKPFQMSKQTSQALNTGYSPERGTNIYSLMRTFNPRMVSMLGARFSGGVYNPDQFKGPAAGVKQPPNNKTPIGGMYEDLAKYPYSRNG